MSILYFYRKAREIGMIQIVLSLYHPNLVIPKEKREPLCLSICISNFGEGLA
jgi:hypothetical protein